jgi:hypothetical protein
MEQLPVLLIGIAQPDLFHRLFVYIAHHPPAERIPTAQNCPAIHHEEHLTFDFRTRSPEAICLSAPRPGIQLGYGGLIGILFPEFNKILLFIPGYVKVDHPYFYMALAALPVSFFNKAQYIADNLFKAAAPAAFPECFLGETINTESNPIDSGRQRLRNVKFRMKIPV